MSKFSRVQSLSQPKECVVCRCDRCGGSGVYHVFGTCYRCGGNGKDPTYRDWGFPADWSDEQCQQFLDARTARLEKARLSRAAKKQAKQLAVYMANLQRHPILAKLHETRGGSEWPYLREEFSEALSPVALDILCKSVQFPLSERQVAVLEKALADFNDREARRAAERAALKAVEAGRRVVEGVVVSVKKSSFNVGYNRSVTQIKVLIKCDGYKLFGTAPASIADEVKAGDSIRLTATVESKELGFGFFSRPTGGEILEAAATA